MQLNESEEKDSLELEISSNGGSLDDGEKTRREQYYFI